MNKSSPYPAVIAIIVLLLALLAMPSGYYVFLRWVICGVAVYYAHARYVATEKLDGWFWILAIIVVLFNPIVPVYLYDKSLWGVIDVVVAIFFTVFIGSNKKLNP